MSAAPEVRDPLDALQDAWADWLRAQRRSGPPAPREYVYASRRQECVRRMALDLLHPEDEPPFSIESLERMERGKEREGSVVARLMQIGPRCAVPFEVIEGQRRFEIPDRDGTLLIVGKIDGRLRFATGDRPVFEVKSGDSFRRCECLDDLDRSPWTRHALDQLLAYLLAEAEPWGILWIDRPEGPLPLRVVLEEHLERAEGFLRDARAAVDARFGKAPLPAYTDDRAECRRCPHAAKSCDAPLDWGAGVQLISDEDLIAAAEERESHEVAHRAFEAADKRLKAALRGVESGILGPFQVTGRWSSQTRYDIPAEIKAQYRQVDERGRFSLSIERVTP